MADFRDEKLTFVFKNLFDTDKNGTIEKDDFESAAERVCKLRNITGTPKHAEVLAGFIKIWEGLKSAADENGDNEVTMEEWLQLWSNKSKCESWSKSYMGFMFTLLDKSGDGTVDEAEFVAVSTGLGVEESESKASFNEITKNGTKELDLTYYSKLWDEFFFSDDKSAPGNLIFGKKL